MSNSMEEICCPSCGARFSLDVAMAGDIEAKYWVEIFSFPSEERWAVHQYVGLWRSSPIRRLSRDRAYRILKETLALCEDRGRLAAACSKTVAQIHAKRETTGKYSAMNSHEYLEKVLSSTVMVGLEKGRMLSKVNHQINQQPANNSKAAQALEKHNAWLDKYQE